MNKKLKFIKKLITTLYWKKYNQMIYVTPRSIFNGKNDFIADIMLSNEKFDNWELCLFELGTWSSYKYYDLGFQGGFKSHFKKQKVVDIPNINKISYTPLWQWKNSYGVFTLPKFGNITEQDIYNCTKYFLNKVLGFLLIGNVKVKIDYEEKKDKVKEKLRNLGIID